MRQISIILIVSSLFSLIPLPVSIETLNILYGLLGVLFSVGMSLIIVFNLKQVLNQNIRRRLRAEIHRVRGVYFRSFFFATTVYIFHTLLKDNIYTIKLCDITLNIYIQFSVLIFFLYCIYTLSSNFIAIHNLYEELEDYIGDELNMK